MNEKKFVYFQIRKMHSRISLMGTTPDRNVLCITGKNESLLVEMNWLQNTKFGIVHGVFVEGQRTALGVSIVRGHPRQPLLTPVLFLTKPPLRTWGTPQVAAPSKNGVKNGPGDLAHSDSAFDIVMALEDHIRLALACMENKSVSRRHHESTCSLVKSICFQLDGKPAAWRGLDQPYSQN